MGPVVNHFEKRELVVKALLRDARPSNRDIALSLENRVSEALVRKVRKELGLPKRADKGGRPKNHQVESVRHPPMARSTAPAPIFPSDEIAPSELDVPIVAQDDDDEQHHREFENELIMQGLTAQLMEANAWDEQRAVQAAEKRIAEINGPSDRNALVEQCRNYLRRKELRKRILDLMEKGRLSAAALVEKMSVEQLEQVVNDLKEIAPSHQDAPDTMKTPAIPITDDEFVKWGLVAALVLVQGWTEGEAVEQAQKMLDEVKDEKDRQHLIEHGREYWEHRRHSQ